MTHPDDDALLDAAVTTDDRSRDAATDDVVLDHVRGCRDCAQTVYGYRQTVQLLQVEDTPRFEAPPEGTWEAIAAELQIEPGGAERPPGEGIALAAAGSSSAEGRWATRSPASSAGVPGKRGRPMRRWPWLAQGVAAGLVLGLLAGALWMGRDEPAPSVTPTPPAPQVLARADLATPDGGPADGQASLVRTAGIEHLDLRAPGMTAPPSGEVYEVWLINRDGTRMVSIGVMPDGTQAQFPVPAGLIEKGFDTVDVSEEPLDEHPAHSGNSLLRGRLGA